MYNIKTTQQAAQDSATAPSHRPEQVPAYNTRACLSFSAPGLLNHQLPCGMRTGNEVQPLAPPSSSPTAALPRDAVGGRPSTPGEPHPPLPPLTNHSLMMLVNPPPYQTKGNRPSQSMFKICPKDQISYSITDTLFSASKIQVFSADPEGRQFSEC